ncbi:MAG: hypothetical protein LAO22_20305 [Acidobacteriia bacterium]|nr:hypothetical protein [Terriglobia bacterium]
MSTTVRFDCYEVDLPAGQLYKHGIRISLRDKSFQVSRYWRHCSNTPEK